MSPEQRDTTDPRELNLRKVALGSPAGLLAFGFGSGLSPVAPGTMGTLVAIPFVFALKGLGETGFWIALVLLFLLGVQLCGRVSQKLGVHDHGGIVWDEMVGYWLAVAFVPLQWEWLLVGFLLFRFFDIVKPWPIRQLDKKVSGGFGIMIDDVVAALFAVILMGVFQYLW
ncbi:MAG: phosphatidylglycerophosphatase A [Gammaproteobacteria bacterium]|nr:phosphatidylglycerophosphatase A [Gammaproteobacteria bacterium]MBT8076673.1 phosphatidylglycerophosphatase A [Gammaproteobacteria bacterium]